MKTIFTTGQVAKICKVTPRTVSKWFDSGRLQGYRITGSQVRRIPREYLIRFLKEHGMTIPEELKEKSEENKTSGDEDLLVSEIPPGRFFKFTSPGYCFNICLSVGVDSYNRFNFIHKTAGGDRFVHNSESGTGNVRGILIDGVNNW